MSKKIEQLKAAVEELKREMADVGARLDEAQGALITAEREARRNEKLTPAMRKVLIAMASGVPLISSDFNFPESYWLEHEDRKSATVRISVFKGLRSREAIDAGVRDGGPYRKAYSLTDHGRSLVG